MPAAPTLLRVYRAAMLRAPGSTAAKAKTVGLACASTDGGE